MFSSRFYSLPILALLGVLAVVSLAACGGNDEEAEFKTAPTALISAAATIADPTANTPAAATIADPTATTPATATKVPALAPVTEGAFTVAYSAKLEATVISGVVESFRGLHRVSDRQEVAHVAPVTDLHFEAAVRRLHELGRTPLLGALFC